MSHEPANELIEAGMARLRARSQALQKRSAEEIIDSLAAVLDQFCDENSNERRELTEQLAKVTGFSRAMLGEGLARGFGTWSGGALRRAIEAELGPLDRLDNPNTRTNVHGFEVTTVLLAGVIPMPSLLAILLPLALRSPVLAKCSRHDPVTAPLAVHALRGIDPALAEHITVLTLPSDKGDALRPLLSAPCVVAYGSDSTIGRIRQELSPTQRFVGYGHRLSLAVLGKSALERALERNLFQRIALDIALWDQLGCLSPVGIYLLEDQPGRAHWFASELSEALEKAQQRWPRATLSAEACAQIQEARADAEVRALSNSRITLEMSHDSAWTVVCEAEATFRAVPLNRFIRVYCAPDLEGLERALWPLAPHLAAVATEGMGQDEPACRRLLARLGASRICRPGQMQSPPLAWHHDNRPLLTPMGRFTDFEAPLGGALTRSSE